MSPDRTAPTTLRLPAAPRSAAPEAPADGFAALLGAADKAAAPARNERRSDEPSVAARPLAARGETAPVPVADPAPQSTPTVPALPAPVVAPPAPVEAAVPAAIAPAPATAPALLPNLPAGVEPVPAAPDATPVGIPGAPAPVDKTPVHPQEGAGHPSLPAAASAPVPISATLIAPVQAPPAPLIGALPAEPATTAPAPAPAAAPSEPVEAPTEAPSSLPTAPATTSQAPTGRGAGTAGEQGPAPREQPAAAEAPAAPPPAAPAPALTPLTQRAAPLHQAPRAVAQVLQVAVERGITHAKLNLRPAELGGIEIRLQTSAAGVTAQVIADSPDAARLLHQAADDLRRALERHDVTLLSLDVSTAGDGRPDGSAGASSDRARHFAAHGLTPKADEAEEPPAVVETIQLDDGLHVDVLA